MKHSTGNTSRSKVDYEYEMEIQQTIINFATSMFQQNKVEEILWDVVQNCIAKLKFEDCVIYMIDDERKVLVQKAAYGPKSIEELKIMNPMEIHIGQGIVGTVAKTGIAEIIKDTSEDPRYIKDDAMRFSEIAIPVIYEGEVFGIIDSEHSQKNFFTLRHLQILTTIASLCANKISRARVEEKMITRELEIAEMKRSLAEAKLIALRSQMSPHFIFNSLNAIQHFIFSEQNDVALTYLNKFSKLIRLILQKANDQVISLEDEINMLELYMQLEALRFSDKFEYEINIDKQINKYVTEVPAMMIQPFVEYAINYSLMNKKDKGKLSLDFKQEDDLIHCSVMDNGIARSESELIKNKRAMHGNDAIENTFKRLATLNAFSEKQSSIEINDLKDDDGIPLGTQVEIILPIEED